MISYIATYDVNIDISTYYINVSATHYNTPLIRGSFAENDL